MIAGNVVPTATSGATPSRRMPGVETMAPPTPKAPESTPAHRPTTSVSPSRSSPGSM